MTVVYRSKSIYSAILYNKVCKGLKRIISTVQIKVDVFSCRYKYLPLVDCGLRCSYQAFPPTACDSKHFVATAWRCCHTLKLQYQDFSQVLGNCSGQMWNKSSLSLQVSKYLGNILEQMFQEKLAVLESGEQLFK